jgi:hypothetical protein
MKLFFKTMKTPAFGGIKFHNLPKSPDTYVQPMEIYMYLVTSFAARLTTLQRLLTCLTHLGRFSHLRVTTTASRLDVRVLANSQSVPLALQQAFMSFRFTLGKQFTSFPCILSQASPLWHPASLSNHPPYLTTFCCQRRSEITTRKCQAAHHSISEVMFKASQLPTICLQAK